MYKESGITWVKEIPSSWEVTYNKYIMKKIKLVQNKYNGEDILSLSVNGVVIKDLNDNSGKLPASYDGYQKVFKGNLLMCLFDIDVTPRCIGIINNNGLTSPAYSQFKLLGKDLHPNYYYYYYLMVDNSKELLHLAKNLRHSLTESDFGSIKVIKPPVNEQIKIADFLDRKISNIDNIINMLKKQINILANDKKSIISELVLNGVLENVACKKSNIKYLPQIPNGWELIKGKYILNILKRPVHNSDEIITCFRDGEVTLRSNRREDGFTLSDKEIGYQGINKGDLVVHGMDGFAGAIGISDTRGKASPVLNVLDSKKNKKYIMYYLRHLAYNDVFIALSTGIRVRSCDLNWKKISNLYFPVPPKEEQDNIVKEIEKKCNKINEIIKIKQSEIGKLENYKKSLIYEYVTGKRRVKGE